jgi:uncharacterized membrane protein
MSNAHPAARPIDLKAVPWHHYAASAVASVLLTLAIIVVTRLIIGDVPFGPGHAEVDAGTRRYMTSPPLPVLLHLATVLPAIPLGIYILLRRKGDRLHKMLGRIWMGLMLFTGIDTLFIHSINHSGQFFGLSPIHIFSFLTLWSVPFSVINAMRGNIEAHRRSVAGLFIGGLVIAGVTAFLPGRFMWLWVFG